MTIKVTYNVTDVYMSQSVSPVYINVSYSDGGASGGGVWGTITGTLSNQTDLQSALDAKVPYTGATGNVDLGEYELKAGQVEFDQTPTGSAGVGVMRWNDADGTVDLGLKGGNVTLQVGQEQVARVVNKTGANLLESEYKVVKVSSAQGQRLAVDLAQANNDNNSADTLGIVTENIDNNQEGFITTLGTIRGINTTGSLQGETWTDGDVLYLSGTTAGAITNVKPTAPLHIVVVGYVEYAHQNNGKIYVKVMNGWELDELHNVSIVTPTNNQGLFYNSSNSLWENKTIATVLGYTPEQPLTFNSPLSRAGNVVSIPQATGSVNGFLSATDWTTFNSKQAALGYTPVPTTRNITINGVTYDLSADRTFSVGSITGNGTTNELAYFTASTTLASLSVSTYPSLTEISYVKGVTSALQTQLNAKQGTLTLTTTGTSGAATLIGNTLNIPQYSGGGGGGISGTIATGQVAIGTAANTIGGSSALTFTSSGFIISTAIATGNYKLFQAINTSDAWAEIKTTGTNNAALCSLSSGDGTTSGRFAYFMLQSLETSPQRWDVGMRGAKNLVYYNSTLNSAALTIDSANNNIYIGTSSALGVRLGVVGDTLLRGSGATSATTALTVQNSSSTNLFSVRNDGAVGIGTNAPSTSLDVVGNIHFRAILRGIQSGGDVVIVGMNAANTAEASRINLRNQSDGSLSIGNQFSGGYISLQCGNGAYTERMRIKNNGQIRFVPLSSAPASPEAGDVYYDSTLNKLRVYTTAWETITSI